MDLGVTPGQIAGSDLPIAAALRAGAIRSVLRCGRCASRQFILALNLEARTYHNESVKNVESAVFCGQCLYGVTHPITAEGYMLQNPTAGIPRCTVCEYHGVTIGLGKDWIVYCAMCHKQNATMVGLGDLGGQLVAPGRN